MLDDKVEKTILVAILKPHGLEMSFSVEVWENPAAWGLFLADLARHIGDANEQAQGIPAMITVSDVLKIFQAEMQRPTDIPRGHLHQSPGVTDCLSN